MIAIIIVNWNGKADTIECLESLLRLDHTNFEIIVVDNASTDGSLDAFREWANQSSVEKPDGTLWKSLPDNRSHTPRLQVVDSTQQYKDSYGASITVIAAGQNLGFAGGNNLGLKWAMSNPDISHIWLLNNDTVVQPDCLRQLEAAANSDPMIGMLGARLMYYHEPHTVQALGGWYSLLLCRGGHIGLGATSENLPSLSQVESRLNYIVGASIFISSDMVRQIGPMYEGYFLYFEEMDWAIHMPEGFRLSTCMDAVVYHKEGNSIGTNGKGRGSNTSIYYLSVNLLRYVVRNEKWALPIAFLRLLRDYIRFFRNKDWAAIGIIHLAVVDFFRTRYRTGPIERW